MAYARWISDSARFWAKVDRSAGPEGCWPWLASCDGAGYGQFRLPKRPVKAYQFAYELANGPTPQGLELDHLCRNPVCVNPRHLEAVTHQVNLLRGSGPPAQHAAKTHCPKGHLYDLINTGYRPNGARRCRTCERDRMRIRGQP